MTDYTCPSGHSFAATPFGRRKTVWMRVFPYTSRLFWSWSSRISLFCQLFQSLGKAQQSKELHQLIHCEEGRPKPWWSCPMRSALSDCVRLIANKTCLTWQRHKLCRPHASACKYILRSCKYFTMGLTIHIQKSFAKIPCQLWIRLGTSYLHKWSWNCCS